MHETNQPVKEIRDLFQNYKIAPVLGSRRSEKGDLIISFLEKINPARKESGYKELTFAGMISLLKRRHIDTEEKMYRLYQECSRAKVFASMFWYKIRL